MPKSKKLKSGSWNVTVFSHMEGGKRKYASFTAPTKSEALLMAAEFKAGKKRKAQCDLTVGEAIDGYIRAKDGVLSPSTIRGYDKMRRNNYGSIEKKKIRSLTSEDVQLFISDLATKHSARTVSNVYGLLRPAVALYDPEKSFRVTLPAKTKKRPVSASSEDVAALLQEASPAVKIRVGLAICGIRRGEMCALCYEDITDGVAHIHRDMVESKDNKWILKDIPKTSGSDRFVKLPPAVLDLIGTGSGRIVKCKPPAVTASFIRLRNRCGVDKRLHDMRGFFASSAAILGIPKIYLADMGGWERDSRVIEAVYQGNMDKMTELYSDQMASYLDNIVKGAENKDSVTEKPKNAKQNAKRK